MKDVNKVLLIGRLGADPVEKETRNGGAMAIFSLATSRKVKSPDLRQKARDESGIDGEPNGALEGEAKGEGEVEAKGEGEVEAKGEEEIGGDRLTPLSATEREMAAALSESWIDETQWHRVVVWGREAQHCLQYLRKGASVFVEGALRSRRFTGKDGIERSWFEVHAESVNFLGGRPSSQAASA